MSLICRKLYRLSGIIFPIVYYFTDKRLTLNLLSATLFLLVLLELLRFKFPSINQVIFRYLKLIVKEEEKKRILGTTYFIFAALLVVLLFKKPIAIISISFSVFGDATATLVGVKWGRIKLGQRSLEGSLAFFLTCLIVGWILFRPLTLNLNIVLIGALAAALIELLPLPFDDNLTVPIFSALAMSLIDTLGAI